MNWLCVAKFLKEFQRNINKTVQLDQSEFLYSRSLTFLDLFQCFTKNKLKIMGENFSMCPIFVGLFEATSDKCAGGQDNKYPAIFYW